MNFTNPGTVVDEANNQFTCDSFFDTMTCKSQETGDLKGSKIDLTHLNIFEPSTKITIFSKSLGNCFSKVFKCVFENGFDLD